MPKTSEERSTLQLTGKGQLTDVLDEGDTLPGHDDWHVIETKGHAQSHLSFCANAMERLLEATICFIIFRPIRSWNPLRRITKSAQNHCFSTGPICLNVSPWIFRQSIPGMVPFFGCGKLIPVRLQKQEKRANKVYDLLLKGAQTPFDSCKQIFPKKYENQLNLTMSETLGQLDYLEDAGLAAKTIKDGIYYYAAKNRA